MLVMLIFLDLDTNDLHIFTVKPRIVYHSGTIPVFPGCRGILTVELVLLFLQVSC